MKYIFYSLRLLPNVAASLIKLITSIQSSFKIKLIFNIYLSIFMFTVENT